MAIALVAAMPVGFFMMADKMLVSSSQSLLVLARMFLAPLMFLTLLTLFLGITK